MTRMMMLAASWVCLLLAAVFADSEIAVYEKVGDEVVLNPASPATDTITIILWKHGLDYAAFWNGKDIELYGQFKDRGRLNVSSGELTLTALTRNDSGLYTPEINRAVTTPTRLAVISPVATPTVLKSCDDDTSCVLTCDGATADAEPLTYTWRSGDKVLTQSAKERRITKEGDSSAREFSCELRNPVSHETSQPIPNPFPPPPGGSLKISTGLTVFICLLVAVVMLVLFHRWKAGAWFFRKESMPWEAAFWSNSERQPNPSREDAEANGATARPLKEETEEETPRA